VAARLTALSDEIEEMQQFVTSSLEAHASDADPHTGYWKSPDGGQHIWTRDTDPGGFANEDDVWVRPVA
jgi:hypothetical protein